MIFLRKRLSGISGQSLLIVIALGAILLIGLVAVFLINQIMSSHQTGFSQRTHARSVAEEGVYYTAQLLSKDLVTWQNALNANFPSVCNSGTSVKSPSGSLFKISCSTGITGNPNLQPYQVAVKVVGQSGTGTSLRAMRAYLSQRTLGVDLATGFHAAAALQLIQQPSFVGSLDVQWGPLVCLDGHTSTPWALPVPIDTGQYPRKFSVGGITNSVSAFTRSGISPGTGPNSDQNEYWAYASQSAVPLVDDAFYRTLAQHTDIATPPQSLQGFPAIPTNCPIAGHPNCGYFIPAPSDTAVFDGGGNGFTLSGGVASAAIYVDGSALFNKVAIDSAAVVVTGGLTIADSNGGSAIDLHVPWSAALEYPYAPNNPATWPCEGQQGDALADGSPDYDCNSTASVFPAPSNVEFRGFLYVKGNMFVNTPTWNFVGALLVGNSEAPPGTSGTLNIPAGNRLGIAYDDSINHAIHMSPVSGTIIQIEPDLLQDIPAF